MRVPDEYARGYGYGGQGPKFTAAHADTHPITGREPNTVILPPVKPEVRIAGEDIGSQLRAIRRLLWAVLIALVITAAIVLVAARTLVNDMSTVESTFCNSQTDIC